MNVSSIANLLSSLGNNGQGSYRFDSLPDLAKEIQMGQIIKGKVLRSLGDSRYAVEIMGHERIVDSSIPLNAQDVIHGKVISIGDKIELARVQVNTQGESEFTKPDQSWDILLQSGSAGKEAVNILQQYRVSLSENEQIILTRQLRAGSNNSAAIMATLLLNKLGIHINSELIQLLASSLINKNSRLETNQSEALIIDLKSAATSSQDSSEYKSLSEHLLKLSNEFSNFQNSVSEENTSHSETESMVQDYEMNHDRDQRNSDNPGWIRYILNIQNEGSVAHRLLTIPFVIDGNLVEIDMALYSQKNVELDGIKYQKILLSLDFDVLGHVDIEAYIANKRVRLHLFTENEMATDRLSNHMGILESTLIANGWKLDEQLYSTVNKDFHGNAINSVIEHHINQDSLSRLY